MLPKASRITSGADFDRIFKTGRKFYSAEAVVFVCPSEPGSAPRFGFIASKKVGNSVVRHQIARWLRETARPYINAPTSVDVVVVARTSEKSIVPATEKLLKRVFS